MNRENIRKTIELLRETKTFDQDQWVTDCGSPACIAGHVVVACGGKLDGQAAVIDGVEREIPTAAREMLGLEFLPAYDLFDGDPFARCGADYADKSCDATAGDAIATLERLLDTGRVRWVRAGAWPRPAASGG